MSGLALTLAWFQWQGKFEISVRPALNDERLADILREGFAFVQEVPLFRYLAVAMIPLGLAYNTVEYHLLYTLSAMDAVTLQTTYGVFKSVTALSLLLIQALVTTRLVNHFGLRRVFSFLPAYSFLPPLPSLACVTEIQIIKRNLRPDLAHQPHR